MHRDQWLAPVFMALDESSDVLVLCRTSATVRAVYRALAARQGDNGWAGLQVVTLPGLLASLQGRVLVADGEDGPLAPVLPVGHAWADRLAERAQLRRALAGHVERLLGAELAGVDVAGVRAELRELLDAGWAAPPWLGAARRILDDAVGFERAVAVGGAPGMAFGGVVAPVDVALVDALGCAWVEVAAPDLEGGPLPAWVVPDSAAEARAVAAALLRHAVDDDADVPAVVLVADSATAERVRATLRRNGVAVADDDASPVGRHALVSILEPLLPLFSGEANEVEARVLLRLFTDPVLRRTPPGRAGVDLPPEIERARASVRHVRRAIVGCHRVRATLADWRAALVEQQERVAADHATADSDDRTYLAARLVSLRVLLTQLDCLAEQVAARPRLGGLATLVSRLGLSEPATDRVGHAIQAALGAAGAWPASPDHFREALSGAVASGRVDTGVEVLSYTSYDGRPASLLIATGVHTKGLAASPSPDTFLAAADMQALGLPEPAVAVQQRLDILRWAASRAHTTLALVARADASGRAVTPPVELDLQEADAPVVTAEASYGLAFDVPEAQDRCALEAGQGEPDRTCRAVDAEWSRGGDVFDDRDPVDPLEPKLATVLEYLDRDEDMFPEVLLPWLGCAGDHPGGDSGLRPDMSLSATRLQPFTRCLFAAFCSSALGLRSREEVRRTWMPPRWARPCTGPWSGPRTTSCGSCPRARATP